MTVPVTTYFRWKNPDLLYFAFGLVVVLTWIQITRHQMWVGDFWDYSGFIAYLTEHPFTVGESVVIGESTLVPYWPFLIVVSAISAAFKVLPEYALAAVGLVNIVWVLYQLHRFCSEVLRDASIAPFVALFALLLWGGFPWFQSNFFHIFVFPYILSYPATFTLGLVLLGVRKFIDWTETQSTMALLIVAVSFVLAVLIHPITSIFLGAGIFGAAASSLRPWRSCLVAAAIGFIGFGVAANWPFFPLMSGVFGTGHASSTGERMYVNVLAFCWPTLILAGPVVVLSLLRPSRDILLLTLGALMFVYGVGFLLELGSFGRVISFIMLVLQLMLARELYDVLAKFPDLRLGLGFALLLVASILLFKNIAVANLTINDCQSSDFLRDQIVSDSVVLTEPQLGKCIPRFKAKTVFSLCQGTYFPKSALEREKDVLSFFAPNSSAELKLNILQKYKVGYVLVAEPREEAVRGGMGSSLYEIRRSGNYILFGVGANSQPGLAKSPDMDEQK